MPTRALSAPTSRPATNTWPLVALSVPATSFRMVDLPQPEGPTRATNSPWLMRSEVSASAVTRFLAPPKATPTFSRSITLLIREDVGWSSGAFIGLTFFDGGDNGHRGVGVAWRGRRHLLDRVNGAAGAARFLLQDSVLHHEPAAHDGMDRQCRGLPSMPWRNLGARLDQRVVDGPGPLEVDDGDIGVRADRQCPLARIKPPDLRGRLRAPAHIVLQRGPAAVNLGQHQRHLGLDAGKSAIDGPDVVPRLLF